MLSLLLQPLRVLVVASQPLYASALTLMSERGLYSCLFKDCLTQSFKLLTELVNLPLLNRNVLSMLLSTLLRTRFQNSISTTAVISRTANQLTPPPSRSISMFVMPSNVSRRLGLILLFPL